jgi:hypothetical protein
MFLGQAARFGLQAPDALGQRFNGTFAVPRHDNEMGC